MISSRAVCTISCLFILVPTILGKAVPDEQTRDERSLDSLMSSSLNHDLSHGLRKSPLSQRSRMDTLTGFGLGRSFDNDYVYYQIPPWMTRPYGASQMNKRNFDQIDAGGFGSFSKRNFDPIDVAGFKFSKRNFDKLDRPGFGDFNKRSMEKRNFDLIDRSGFGAFSRR